MNNVRQIRNTLYMLKKTLGFPISILTTRTLTQDIQTGEVVHDERLIKVRKVIIATQREIRDFAYDLSYIAANKNFTMGGIYDQARRVMILDDRDLPSDYEPTLNDRCIYAKTRWEFKEIQATAANVGWLIRMQHLDSQPLEDVIEESIQQTLPVEDEPWNQ